MKKKIALGYFFNFFNISVPSQAPTAFTVIATNSTTIKASWQISPADSRRDIIKGFKMFYKKEGIVGLGTEITINGSEVRSYYATGLNENTEYEFQVAAFTSAGNGPRSSVNVVRTVEDGKNTSHAFFC